MKKRLLLTLFILAVFALSGCAERKAGVPPAPSVSIGIAPFHQPASTREMLAGYMPENTPRVEPKILAELDGSFEDVLRTDTSRDYTGVDKAVSCVGKYRDNGLTAFPFWLEVGRCMNVDLILVPQVHAWQERQGGELGVERPAAVILDFFLLDVKTQTLTARSRYDETQRALSQNVLDVGKFINRRGRWVTAHELAREGMVQAIRELGL